ncbi:MAG: pyruvate dehydrogenase E2 component (dihydrolipoamide acetyltransferase) [Parcubacteria group bacterium Gr01-1014_29]|nr:MAG: pyruvate dehydrogenase E2 component (dihydrolipoamide acetyltransferase) [Parcubacteria group bacterium Gr01-1014_29]
MRVETRIPRQGIEYSVQEVTISQWLVQNGENVTIGQVVCEVDTSKGLLEVETPASGTIEIIWHNLSQEIRAKELTADGNFLTTIIAVIETEVVEKSTISVPPKRKVNVPSAAREEILLLSRNEGISPEDIFAGITKGGSVEKITKEMVRAYDATLKTSRASNISSDTDKIPAVYAARTIAAQKGVDLSLVKGTGPEGIITVDDVIKEPVHLEEKKEPAPLDLEFEPASVIRKTIAWNLTLGYAIPTAASKELVSGMGELLTFKKRHGKRFQELYGMPYAITFPIASAIVRVLGKPQFRKLNAHTVSTVQELIPGFPCLVYTGIKCRKDINLGISFNDESRNGESNLKIATAKSLQGKSLKEIAVALHNAMTGAEKGKSEFLSDWTFILNNVGGINDHEGHSILTGEVTPELTINAITAELNIGAIDKDTGKATMQLFFDHRPFDGKLASSFRQAVYRELMDNVLQKLAESLY